MKKLFLLLACLISFNLFAQENKVLIKEEKKEEKTELSNKTSDQQTEQKEEKINGWRIKLYLDQQELYNSKIDGRSGTFQKQGNQSYVASINVSKKSNNGPLCNTSRMSSEHSCVCNGPNCKLVKTLNIEVGVDLKIEEKAENKIDVTLYMKAIKDNVPELIYIKEEINIKDKKEFFINKDNFQLVLNKF